MSCGTYSELHKKMYVINYNDILKMIWGSISYLFIFFLYFICFWVFTLFTSTQDTSQISTCINLHYTTLLHKENTTTLDYENKRKENAKAYMQIILKDDSF